MRFRISSLVSIGLCLALGGAVSAEQGRDMLQKGLDLRVDFKPEKAVEAFSAVLSDDPWNSEALVQMGAALEDLKRWSQAAEAYRRALEVDSANWVARRNLQQLVASRDMHKPLTSAHGSKENLIASGLAAVERGDYSRAVEIFQLCRGLAPNDPKPLFYWAFCLERSGRSQDAVQLYEQIVAWFPSYAPAWTNLIIALLSTGDREGAERRIGAALKALPNNRRLLSLQRLTAMEERTALSSPMGSGP